MQRAFIRRIMSALIAFCLFSSVSLVWGFPQVKKINDSVVDAQALTIQGGYGQAINGLAFQQDAIITDNGYQYVGYYNGNRHVCLARRKLPADTWAIIEFDDYNFTNNDAHNTISVGICPNDGTIHVAFDHHGNTLHYRISKAGVTTNPTSITWNASLFGPVRSYLEQGKTITGLTYPAFIQTPDGNMQMIYRVGGSGNGNWVLVDYSGSSHLWSNTRKFISSKGTFTDEINTSKSRCAYPNYYTYDNNGYLHVTWCWREHTQGANHDIMYSYSKDGGKTWLHNESSLLKIAIDDKTPQTPLRLIDLPKSSNIIGLATGNSETEKLIRIDSPGVTVVNIPRRYGMLNTQAQAVDSQGRVHVVIWHCSDASFDYATKSGYDAHLNHWGHPYARRYHHYWRDHDGTWHHHELPWVAGNRPQLFVKSNGDAFLVYNASRKPKNMLSGSVQFSDGDLKIAAATQKSNWTDWQVIHTEPGMFVNEMLCDQVRLKQNEQVLSIMVQDSPSQKHQSTPLRILDFSLN